MRALRLALVTLTACVGLVGHADAAGPTLLQHRAVYDLTLDRATDRSGINGIAGRMVYEFKGSACEGYTVRFRFVTRIETDETSRLTDQQTTTHEDASGKTFRFMTKSFVDEILDQEVQGTAAAAPEGTIVTLEKPEPRTLELGHALFPTGNLKEMLQKAQAGNTFYQTPLFDGSENGDEVVMTSVVVGDPVRPAQNDPELPAMKPIASDPFWPVTVAYFDGKETSGEEMPDYAISFKLHKSGITRDLKMNYGEFSIDGRLVDLALFEPAKNCATR